LSDELDPNRHLDRPARRAAVRWGGLVGGPLLGLLTLWLLPDSYTGVEELPVEFTLAGRMTLAVMVWMATWWLTEAIDIAATALLPLVLFPLTGVLDMKSAAAPYANPLIFLFMGGFLIALAMQRWGVAERLALLILGLAGSRATHVVGGFMAATALLSMFVSNTATTAILLPIGLSVIALAESRGTTVGAPRARTAGAAKNFGTCLLLAIAYSASIGGLATIIGTPPNAFLVTFVRDTVASGYRQEISFARWLSIGFPLTAVFLPLVWLLLTRVLFPVGNVRLEGGASYVRERLDALGRPGRGERIVLVVFSLTALSWILRPLIQRIELPFAGGRLRPFAGWSDAGIAMTGALLLFALPVSAKRHEFALDWSAARRLPWGVLILFGGGLSLAAAVTSTGVAAYIGNLVVGMPRMPPALLVLVVATLVIFLTELTSNTATTATLLPILAAVAPGLGVHPYLLIFPAALAASCAFMMPVATPPNAIVFASGRVTIPQMCRAGLALNLIGVVLVTLLTLLIVEPTLVQVR
jgi:sodium-dependent dicarboxylate transporter 2/3/5